MDLTGTWLLLFSLHFVIIPLDSTFFVTRVIRPYLTIKSTYGTCSNANSLFFEIFFFVNYKYEIIIVLLLLLFYNVSDIWRILIHVSNLNVDMHYRLQLIILAA